MTVRRWVQRHPEWWALLLSAGAWALLLDEAIAHGGTLANGSTMTMADGTRMTMSMSPDRALSSFALMVAAMMLPLAVASIRATAARSLWRRRQLATIEYLLGFVSPWVFVGAALIALGGLAGDAGLPGLGRASALLALVLAALWQLTGFKRRALKAHHRTQRLAPRTPRADCDCLLFGLRGGWQCVVSCGPMMGAMLLAAHSLLLMVALTGVVVIERYRYRPPRTQSAVLLAALAVISVA
jgi:hypothetical protein